MAGRVLIVSPIASHPQDQGNGARIFALGRLLQSAGLIVHMLWYPLEGWRADQQIAMAGCWDHLHVPPTVTIDLAPTGGDHHGLDDWSPPEITEYAARLHRRWRFDAVLCHYVWFSSALTAFGADVLKLLDTHDVFAERHRRLQEDGLEPAWFSTSVEEETRGLARADIVLAIQDDEAVLFRARGHPDVRVLGHLARGAGHLVRDTGRLPITAGFLASGNPLNRAAFAALRQNLPSAPIGMRLVVAGVICDEVDDAAPFVKLGRLEHVDAFYETVDVALNPMAGGTGLKIKSVEAVFQGIPLVATQAAMTGLPTRHALHRLAGPGELAACLREVRFGLTLRSELAAASRQAARDYAETVQKTARSIIKVING